MIGGFQNITPNTSSDEQDVLQLIQELEELVGDFAHSDTFKRDIYEGSEEDHYTETLIKYFENVGKDNKVLNRFSFKPQVLQQNRRTCDIGVHLKVDNEHYIFCIEAKFLPHSPNDYVTGDYAAIKRFKCNQHGHSKRNPKESRLLPQNGIVAYVKSGEFKDHLGKINDKIIGLAKMYSTTTDKYNIIWQVSEKLVPKKSLKDGNHISKHTRIDGSELILHHFWVYLDEK